MAYMVGVKGFEPSTHWSQTSKAIQHSCGFRPKISNRDALKRASIHVGLSDAVRGKMPTERDTWEAAFMAELQQLRPGMYYPGKFTRSITNTAWVHRGEQTGREAARAWCAARPLPGVAPAPAAKKSARKL